MARSRDQELRQTLNASVAENLVREPRSKAERYREILAVLAHHGIDAAEARIAKHGVEQLQIRATHFREACEELGTVFIKLGQMLSTRGDLLPEPYRVELAKLQDGVPPLPFNIIAEVIQEDLGASTEELFSFVAPQPMGSASIGQVHEARLTDGSHVVVKVRKPGVDRLVHLDLGILADIVDKWTPRFPVLEQFDARGLVREFSDTLLAELDYRREAANERAFKDAFSKRTGFKIPEVVEKYSSERVLTMERLEGSKVSDLAEMSKRRRVVVAQRIARFFLEPAFEQGLFYADPHAGNLLIQDDGTVGVFDFGMVGRLAPEARAGVAGIFIAVGRCDAQRLTDRLVEVAAPARPVDRALIAAEVERLLDQYVSVSFEHLHLDGAIRDLLQLLRRNCLRLPSNVAAFFKAFAMCEGVLRSVDPDSSLTDYLEPLAGKLVSEDIAGGERFADRARDSAFDAAQLMLELPGRIDRVLREVERGNLRIWTRVEDTDAIVKRAEHMVARLSAAILGAASIIGLAVVMQFYHPQGWEELIHVVFWTAIAVTTVITLRTIVTMRK